MLGQSRKYQKQQIIYYQKEKQIKREIKRLCVSGFLEKIITLAAIRSYKRFFDIKDVFSLFVFIYAKN